MVKIDEVLTQLQALDSVNLMPSTQQKMNGYYNQLRQFSENNGISDINQALFEGFVSDNHNNKHFSRS